MEWKETPLINISGIFAKLECTNPCGSIKDRIAKYIIEKSEESGTLKPGMTIIEATSGNTGISLSCYAKKKGYKATLIMPKNMTEERKQLIRNLGAELILCSAGDFAQAAQIRDEMAKQDGYFNTDQFSNPLNVQCHKLTTADEIIRQIKPSADKIDAFVAGVGTGGTLIGVASALKEIYPDVRIVAVEPAESPVMSGGKPGNHGIQGIGDGFIPAIASDGKGGLNPLIDDVICVTTDQAVAAAKQIEQKYDHCVGVSSGANFIAAQKLAKTHKTVVTVFADGYLKYKSQGLKHCRQNTCQHEVSLDCLPNI